MDFVQVDVFAENAYQGNALAVFPDGGSLTREQMQSIAREMNLSESTFVTSVARDSYDVRIFTPTSELPFAGHPTIGTAWVLRHKGSLTADRAIQRSPGGETSLTASGDTWSFRRQGSSEPDLHETSPELVGKIARALGLDLSDIGLEAREMGRPGRLMPAYADAGLRQLLVPLTDTESLGRAQPNAALLSDLDPFGAYCFTATGAGMLQARGFWPGLGIIEDPATGSAAASLGLYLAEHLGDIELRVRQGLEMGRPSLIQLTATHGEVSVGGGCRLVLRGSLEALPKG